MKVKTSELIGAALDWAVAKCEGHKWRCPWLLEKEGYVAWRNYERAWGNPTPPYSTDWSQGGPIIEQWAIDLLYRDSVWRALRHVGDWPTMGSGPTPLVAAMRCYVSSRFGDEVEIPELS